MSANRKTRVFVAGGRGLVGSALIRRLTAGGYEEILAPSSHDLDLRKQERVHSYFHEKRPEVVYLAAAKVGGIGANATYPADFIRDNLLIQTNVLDAAHRSRVGRLVFLASSCIYPRLAPQPLKEEYLLTGPLEHTNRPYAVAKIAGIEMVEAYRRQYDLNWISVMPTNLYGPEDNFDLNSSHVIPALIRKFHEGKMKGCRTVVVWGSGRPRREFLHVDDLADATVCIGEGVFDISRLVNIGCGIDITIRELSELIRDVVGFEGAIQFDSTKPDGTPRKLLDVTKLKNLGWQPRVGIRQGLEQVYSWFRLHLEKENAG